MAAIGPPIGGADQPIGVGAEEDAPVVDQRPLSRGDRIVRLPLADTARGDRDEHRRRDAAVGERIEQRLEVVGVGLRWGTDRIVGLAMYTQELRDAILSM